MMNTGQPTSGLAPINGTQIHYEQAGQGRPLVLIHAGIADSRMWHDQWEAFAAHYRVIRYDVRGFGHSSRRSGSYSNLDDLMGLLDYLEVGQAVLLGASMGGAIAIDFTLAHPERVSGLITACAGLSGYQFSAQVHALWERIGAAFEAGDVAGAVELELQMWVDGPGRTPEQVPEAVRERVRVMETANIAQNAEEIESDAPDSPAIGRLADIRVPTLVLVGEYDVPDMLVIADRLAAEIAGARKVIVPETAHLPNMERPDEFNHLVLDFLQSLDKP